MKSNFRLRFILRIFFILLLSKFMFINQVKSQPLTKEVSAIATEKDITGTRIVISTSGPAKFSSHWSDDPPRLVVEFQSRNILSKIDKEVIVNQGVIKRITSSYSGKGKRKSLKSLTFELTQKVPYKIWQEDNTILLDIHSPLETSVFSEGGKEIFAGVEVSDVVIKRLEAMDTALMQVTESQTSLETFKAKVNEENPREIIKAKEEAVLAETEVSSRVDTKERKNFAGMIFWLVGSALISGLGFLVWYRFRLNKDKKLKELESEVRERDRRLEQEEVIRKGIEETSLKKEREYENLRNTFGSLRDELVKKGLVKRKLSAEEKERPWVPGKSKERRSSSRLPLTRDFSNTIILRIESPDKHENIKCFAKDISPEGLCFETTTEIKQNGPLNLRLFFYGGQVPMMRIKGHIVWKKQEASINYYGLSFDVIEEKDKLEFDRYIETKKREASS